MWNVKQPTIATRLKSIFFPPLQVSLEQIPQRRCFVISALPRARFPYTSWILPAPALTSFSNSSKISTHGSFSFSHFPARRLIIFLSSFLIFPTDFSHHHHLLPCTAASVRQHPLWNPLPYSRRPSLSLHGQKWTKERSDVFPHRYISTPVFPLRPFNSPCISIIFFNFFRVNSPLNFLLQLRDGQLPSSGELLSSSLVYLQACQNFTFAVNLFSWALIHPRSHVHNLPSHPLNLGPPWSLVSDPDSWAPKMRELHDVLTINKWYPAKRKTKYQTSYAHDATVRMDTPMPPPRHERIRKIQVDRLWIHR